MGLSFRFWFTRGPIGLCLNLDNQFVVFDFLDLMVFVLFMFLNILVCPFGFDLQEGPLWLYLNLHNQFNVFKFLDLMVSVFRSFMLMKINFRSAMCWKKLFCISFEKISESNKTIYSFKRNKQIWILKQKIERVSWCSAIKKRKRNR